MSSSAAILIVEDELSILNLLKSQLQKEYQTVDTATSCEEADDLIHKKNYQVLILDWMLPGMSGVQFASRLRSQDHHELSILMLTAKSQNEDIVEGLSNGADDYLTKPFDIHVLKARVDALLRRYQFAKQKQQPNDVVQLGKLRLYPELYESYCGDEKLELTPSEFKLLLTLAQNKGRVLTRDSLIEQIQGEGVSVVGRTVDTHVFGLRKKLGDCSELIETVRGIGYRVKFE